MTLSEIDRIAEIFIAAGRGIPVCPHQWREFMASRIGKASITTDPKTGKRRVKPKGSPPVFAKAKEEKTNRMVKRLRANREKTK